MTEEGTGMNLSARTTRQAARSALLGSVLVALGACSASGSSPPAAGAARPASPARPAPAVSVGTNPQNAVLDPATGTLYVITDPGNNADGAVAVVNALTCSTLRSSGCADGVAAEVQVGDGPVAIAVDQPTNTIYVANSNSNTVSVINGATCNARTTSGCGHTPAAVTAGNGPVDVTVNQATDTVYVANWGNGTGTTVSVIDGATCNGEVSTGCRHTPAHVSIRTAPAGVTADQATDTIYAATVGPYGAETISVINGATCNAATVTGCGKKSPTVTAGTGSPDYNVAFAIDGATATLYVANYTASTLSMINEATCNAANTSGCARAPRTVRVGRGPDGIAINPETHTIYTANVTNDTLSVLNAATCNATITSGCTTRPARTLRTGHSPRWITFDQATDTLYVTNGDDADMSVLDGATCNATDTSGCN
jgi:serine/threonine protein kinase, bacterial